jgi:superfamily II DNA or RNA helicase
VIKVALSYDKGTILIRGIAHIPFAAVDPRTNQLRALALYYTNIMEYIKQSGIEYVDNVLDLLPSPHIKIGRANDGNHGNNLSLRDYQQKALDSWIRARMRGCVVLPTGSGKTVIAIKSVEAVNAASLVVVPTLDLMDQWTSVISKYFPNIKIGNLGGGADDIQPITVSTYDSAYIRGATLGNKFSLTIFDEVHHLAAPGYKSIAEQLVSPFRLGLTATFEREDGLHTEIPKLVGGVVFQKSSTELAEQRHLASYKIERRQVEMLPDEIESYKNNYEMYQSCLRSLGFRYPIPFEKLVMISGRNKVAREALLARNRAMDIALNSRSKMEELREILAEKKGIKTIIFTQHNRLVYEISNTFLIPCITYKTDKDERQDIIKSFKNGKYNAIVTSKVLDEGVDVPDAELGIILSGTGSGREFIQRLGRLLRPKGDVNKNAILIEITSAETGETRTSAKRRKALYNERITVERKEEEKEEEEDEEEEEDKEDKTVNNSTNNASTSNTKDNSNNIFTTITTSDHIILMSSSSSLPPPSSSLPTTAMLLLLSSSSELTERENTI